MNVGQRLQTQRPGIAFVGRPRGKLHVLTMSTTCGSLPNVSRVHSSAICFGLRSGFQASRPKPYRFAIARWIAQPVVIEADIDDADKAAEWSMKRLARHNLLHRRRCRPSARMSKSSISFHMGTRKRCRCWPVYSWVICSSIASFVCLQPAEQRRNRLAHLKIDRAVLDLDNHVVVELAIERMEIVISRAGAVVFQVRPVQMMVVDKSRDRKRFRHAA